MSKLQKYDSYKDSDVEWLGEIPTEWEVKKIKYIFRENSIKNHGHEISLAATQLYGVVPKNSLNFRTVEANISDLNIFKLVKVNNFVISLRSFEGGIEYSEYQGIISPAYTVIEAIQDINYKYMKYLFKSNIFIQALNIYKTGIREGQNISFAKLKDDFLPFPSKEEQTYIASFLDTKTQQLDKVIKQKEQLIELLKERKQIVINEAVTKGIDKTVTMKDSGVEWIGKIPKHWEVKKLFGLCNFIRGNSSFSKDELLNIGKYVALQYGKTYKINEINEKYKFYVNDEFYKSSQIINFGDTIFVSTSETIEDLGHTAYYKRSDLGLLGGEQILLKPKIDTLDSKYLYFSSKVFSKELKKFATGIKVFRFNINNLKTIYMSIPPIQEQQQIVGFIENQTSKIDHAINLQQKQINKLKEYKNTLIDSVVTGKVRVDL